MTRLIATVVTDVRLQVRNGFYLATLLVLVVSIVLLRSLPRDLATSLLSAVVLGNVVMNAFYFAAGLVLLERVEGTLLAQAVTPLRPGQYLIAKLVTLTVLSVAESAILAAAAFGVHTWLIGVALGIALAAVLFCLVGIATAVRYQSINEFLLPSVLYTFLLCLPLLGVLGVGSTPWYLWHPIQGVVSLMRIDQPLSPAAGTYAVLYPLVWSLPAYLWCRRVLARERVL